MKIVLYGASGMIGSRLLSEALGRGHAVTLVVRDRQRITPPKGRVLVVEGDVLDATSVAAAVKGHDAVLSAVGPTPEIIAGAARSLIEGLTRAGVKRLVVVGGAGTLEVAPGVLLLQTPQFPAEYELVAQAHGTALNTFRQNTTLDWTFVSPAAFIQPGERTGRFRLGGDQLLVDAKGDSRISAEDFAVAFLDEVEKPAHLRQRFTVAY
jgi:putative NADH-flavin reductase